MTKKQPSPSHTRADTKSRNPKSDSGADKSPGTAGSTASDVWQSWFAPSAIREVVESVVIAFVLAFLFRTFEAEAFVIPTGSMAPTLMGRHKDVFCEKCGYEFQASASNEVDAHTGNPTNCEVVSGTCPMCRHTMDFSPRNVRRASHPSFTGDRILVGKFPYQFGDPARWDVAVFRFPGGATTNFIKRVVGLPKETIRLMHGDLWVKPDGENEFALARKSPEKIRAVLQPVYDNDYVLPDIIQQGWPARWANEGAGAWTSDDYKSFRVAASANEEVWLRYRHFVPSANDWQKFLVGSAPAADSIRPQLISDFCAYNTGMDGPAAESRRQRAIQWGDSPQFPSDGEAGGGTPGPNVEGLGLHWVGDLALEASLEVQSPAGEVVLELIKAGRRFQCVFDLAKGTATLSIGGQQEFHPTAATAVRGPGTYRVLLANVDHQLTLWVNHRVVSFDRPTVYDAVGDDQPQPADLSPVGIASRGAALRVQHLKVFRDIYYIAAVDQTNGLITDYDPYHFPLRARTQESVAQFLSDPRQWGPFAYRQSVEFHLDADQFFVLGDNSAESRDSRLWGREYYVKRDLLIGKALFIYWPHSWNRTPYVPIPFPFFPNFARMGLVR